MLRAQVEIAELDETADAERILQIRTDALNQQMSLQRDRVRMLTAELQSLTAAHGENAAITQRAAIRLERERLALSNLEQELSGLNETLGETNGIFGELQNMLPAMPTKLEALGMAFGVVTAGIGAAATATKELLLDEFRELQNQSYELNMSFPDTRKFLRELRLADGDIGDFEGYIRGISDAYVKGEYDDPEFIALRKYGAEIVDATGRLKEFKDITEEVYQAWKKAEAAGEGIEFLKMTAAQKDLIQASSGFQLIEGDKVTNTPQSFEQISGDQIILPTQELQQFGDKVQETTSELEPLQKLTESAQGAADAQKSLADSTKLFPHEYLKNLADGAKSVSETQSLLTKSTLDLITAQKDLAKAFENLPKVKNLSALETPLKSIDEKIQGVQQAMQDKAAIDFSELVTPLNAIDEKTQSILQAMQDE